jgi:hypothetical protein
LLGALSKWLGRRDNDNAPHWNEAAVGTSVVVMTTGKVFSDLCAPDAQVLVLAVVALLAFLTILAFSGADRHFSWERVGSVVTNRKRFWVGVVIPDLIAFGLFVCYQKMKLNGYFN